MPVDQDSKAYVDNALFRLRSDLELQIREAKISVRDQGIKLDKQGYALADLQITMYGRKEPYLQLGVYTMTDELWKARLELKTLLKWALPILGVLQGLSFLGIDLSAIIKFLSGLGS
jgi:hypothetical protein